MLDSPLHPLLVHFPIVLYLFGTVALIVSLWKDSYFRVTSFWLLAFGWMTGAMTYLTGDDAEAFARRQWHANLESTLHMHKTYAFWTMIIFSLVIGLLILEFLMKKKALFRTLAVLLAILGIYLLVMTGHYGGKMVYDLPHQSSTPSHP